MSSALGNFSPNEWERLHKTMGELHQWPIIIDKAHVHNSGAAAELTLCSFVAFCSGLMGKPLRSQMVVLGDMSLGGTIVPASNLAELLQVDFDSGARSFWSR